MDGVKFQAARGHLLDSPGHPRGVSCGAQGPSLGPIRLLLKTADGFEPRPVAELNVLLGRIFARPIDCAGLQGGLWAAARALNEGELVRAMIATQHMRLPYLSEDEARRAASAEALSKASPDDPDHPGWPAGAAGARGGQFRPKDRADEDANKIAADHTRRVIARRAFRAGLRTILARAPRLAGEALSNLVPGLDVVGDVAMIADLGAMAGELAASKRDADAAIEFAKNGPRKLDELRVDMEDKSFPSYDAFKKVDLSKIYGPAGDGYQYHHIVEQSAEGDVSASDLNSTSNIVRIPKLLHEEINSEYATTDRESGVTRRAKLKGKSFEEQREEGVDVMREIGIIE
ncbi:MAG: hypothetical protein WB816_09170 [Methylocystis sp.]